MDKIYQSKKEADEAIMAAERIGADGDPDRDAEALWLCAEVVVQSFERVFPEAEFRLAVQTMMFEDGSMTVRVMLQSDDVTNELPEIVDAVFVSCGGLGHGVVKVDECTLLPVLMISGEFRCYDNWMLEKEREPLADALPRFLEDLDA